MPVSLTRLLAQIRMSGKKRVKLTYRGCCYFLEPEAVCSVCNMQSLESINHLMFECPVYDPIRPSAIKALRDIDGLVAVLDNLSIFYLKTIAYYLVNLLKIRSFIVNE